MRKPTLCTFQRALYVKYQESTASLFEIVKSSTYRVGQPLLAAILPVCSRLVLIVRKERRLEVFRNVGVVFSYKPPH
jgi:hypothetical protein